MGRTEPRISRKTRIRAEVIRVFLLIRGSKVGSRTLDTRQASRHLYRPRWQTARPQAPARSGQRAVDWLAIAPARSVGPPATFDTPPRRAGPSSDSPTGWSAH